MWNKNFKQINDIEILYSDSILDKQKKEIEMFFRYLKNIYYFKQKIKFKFLNKETFISRDKEEVVGSCYWSEDINDPIEINIAILETESIESIVYNVAHELTHYFQFINESAKKLNIGMRELEAERYANEIVDEYMNYKLVKGQLISVADIKSVFDFSIKNEKVISIYDDKDNYEDYIIGKILQYNDKQYMIMNFNFYGEYDGIEIRKVSEIFKVLRDTKYEKKIDDLISINNEKIPKIELLNNDYIATILRYAEDDKLIKFKTQNRKQLIGKVKSYSSDKIIIDLIDEYGKGKKENIVSVERIKQILVDDKELRQIIKLMLYNEFS